MILDNLNLNDLLDVILSTIAIIGALFAAVKFKLYRPFERRYKTEIEVKSHKSKNGELFIVCTYVIYNIGDLPISLSEVSLDIYDYETDKNVLKCNETKSLIVEPKIFEPSNPKYTGLMRISAGERSEFPIRAVFSEYKEVLFVYGNFKWTNMLWVFKRKPSEYHHTILVGNTIDV